MLRQINSLDEYLLKQTVTNSLNEQALCGLFRAVLEPVLELNTEDVESDVVFKVTNRGMFTGLLTRLEFSEIQYIDYGRDERGKENLDETDFLLVATSDFISFIAWKYVDNEYKTYYLINSSEIYDIIGLLNDNSDLDLEYLKEKYNISKVQNNMTSSCLSKLSSMLNDSNFVNSDVVDNEDLSKKIETLSKKARYISHEIKNQLSIGDLYLGILKRYCENNAIEDETILHSIKCLNKSLKIAGCTLSQLKSLNSKELKLHQTDKLVNAAVDLASAYLENRDIKLELNNNVKEEIFVDQILFVSSIINLIKNACEAFDHTDNKHNWIKVETKIENDNVLILISNNAKPIQNPEEIFNEGMTTKSTGSGLGLFISKKNIEEQCGQLSLVKSDENSTVFEMRFCL